jgi:hypothetical protein
MTALASRVSTKLTPDSPVVSAALEHDARNLLELLACRHGRSVSAELRAAVRRHLTEAAVEGLLPEAFSRPSP